jgi:hypothetical protein
MCPICLICLRFLLILVRLIPSLPAVVVAVVSLSASAVTFCHASWLGLASYNIKQSHHEFMTHFVYSIASFLHCLALPCLIHQQSP